MRIKSIFRCEYTSRRTSDTPHAPPKDTEHVFVGARVRRLVYFAWRYCLSKGIMTLLIILHEALASTQTQCSHPLSVYFLDKQFWSIVLLTVFIFKANPEETIISHLKDHFFSSWVHFQMSLEKRFNFILTKPKLSSLVQVCSWRQPP